MQEIFPKFENCKGSACFDSKENAIVFQDVIVQFPLHYAIHIYGCNYLYYTEQKKKGIILVV